MSDRLSRRFYYVRENGTVTEVTGYICEGTAGYWWCPEVGVSACEGHHLFADRVQALDRGRGIAMTRFQEAQATLVEMTRQRWGDA